MVGGTPSNAPIRGLLGGLGRAWTTETLSIKSYPGCAYLDTVLDAISALGPPPADDVRHITLEASALTCAMDAWSAPYRWQTPLTPVTATFSVALNLAIALLAGEVTPRQLNQGWLDNHLHALLPLAACVEVRHSPRATLAVLSAFAPILPPRTVARAMSVSSACCAPPDRSTARWAPRNRTAHGDPAASMPPGYRGTMRSRS